MHAPYLIVVYNFKAGRRDDLPLVWELVSVVSKCRTILQWAPMDADRAECLYLGRMPYASAYICTGLQWGVQIEHGHDLVGSHCESSCKVSKQVARYKGVSFWMNYNYVIQCFHETSGIMIIPDASCIYITSLHPYGMPAVRLGHFYVKISGLVYTHMKVFPRNIRYNTQYTRRSYVLTKVGMPAIWTFLRSSTVPKVCSPKISGLGF